MTVAPFRLRKWKRRMAAKMSHKLATGYWWFLCIFRPTDEEVAQGARLIAQAERLVHIDDVLAKWRESKARRAYAEYVRGMS